MLALRLRIDSPVMMDTNVLLTTYGAPMKTLLAIIITLIVSANANAQHVAITTNDHNDLVTISVTINADQVTGDETYGKFTFENNLDYFALGTYVHKGDNGVVTIVFHTNKRNVVAAFQGLAITNISLGGKPVKLN
jgi:uncharacterized protein YxeA